MTLRHIAPLTSAWSIVDAQVLGLVQFRRTKWSQNLFTSSTFLAMFSLYLLYSNCVKFVFSHALSLLSSSSFSHPLPPSPLRMRTCSNFAVIFLYRKKVDFPEASLAFIWYVLRFSHSLPRFSVSMRNLFAFRLFSLPNTSWFTRSFQMSIL